MRQQKTNTKKKEQNKASTFSLQLKLVLPFNWSSIYVYFTRMNVSY